VTPHSISLLASNHKENASFIRSVKINIPE